MKRSLDQPFFGGWKSVELAPDLVVEDDPTLGALTQQYSENGIQSKSTERGR